MGMVVMPMKEYTVRTTPTSMTGYRRRRTRPPTTAAFLRHLLDPPRSMPREQVRLKSDDRDLRATEVGTPSYKSSPCPRASAASSANSFRYLAFRFPSRIPTAGPRQVRPQIPGETCATSRTRF
jgi:hypothetical protein